MFAVTTESSLIIPASALRIAAAAKGAESFQLSAPAHPGKYAAQYAEVMATAGDRVVAVLRIRVVEGQYPNYSALVPEGFAVSVDCDGDALRAALQSAASVAQANQPVKLTADSTRKYLAVTVRNNLNDATGEWYVPCQYHGVTDDELTIGVNAQFANDGAKCIGANVVTLNVISPLRPMLMTQPGDGGANPHYVLMPIRI